MTDRTCEHCGEPIAAGRPASTKFCCERHQQAAWYEASRGSAARRAAYRRAAEQRRAQRRDRIDAALERHRQAAVGSWREEREDEA